MSTRQRLPATTTDRRSDGYLDGHHPSRSAAEAHVLTPVTRGTSATRPMNVLVLHAELGTLRGGGENFTNNLFAAFAARGHNVKAAFTADLLGRYPFTPPDGVTPIPVRGVWSRSFGQAALAAVHRRIRFSPDLRRRWEHLQHAVGWRASHWNNVRFQRRIGRRLASELRGVDAVYVHSNPFLAAAVADVCPTVLRLPGPLTSESMPHLSRVHAVCANGDALLRIREFLGDKALELPVGLDDRLFAPGPESVRPALGWNAEQRVVGYVGRLTHIKGVDILAEAFLALAHQRSDARLLIIGTGEQEGNLRSMLRTEIARGLVHFAGDVPHDQLPAWYRALNVLVMPSRYENFSNAVLEALACGIPFVGSNVGGNRALFDTGAAWLFDAKSAESLATVLERALSNAHELQQRGERGRAYVAGRYSWTATARRLEEIMHRLVQREN